MTTQEEIFEAISNGRYELFYDKSIKKWGIIIDSGELHLEMEEIDKEAE